MGREKFLAGCYGEERGSVLRVGGRDKIGRKGMLHISRIGFILRLAGDIGIEQAPSEAYFSKRFGYTTSTALTVLVPHQIPRPPCRGQLRVQLLEERGSSCECYLRFIAPHESRQPVIQHSYSCQHPMYSNKERTCVLVPRPSPSIS